MDQRFNIEDFTFFTGLVFAALFILFIMTGMAKLIGGVVGVIILYIMLGISAGVGYYITAYTDV